MYIYIYIYMIVCVYIYICIYMYIYVIICKNYVIFDHFCKFEPVNMIYSSSTETRPQAHLTLTLKESLSKDVSVTS